MATENMSYLKALNAVTKINVLSFKDLNYDNFLKTGKIVGGEISFSYRFFDFDMGASHYEVIHNEKTYRFKPESMSYDLKGNTIVSGSLIERN